MKSTYTLPPSGRPPTCLSFLEAARGIRHSHYIADSDYVRRGFQKVLINRLPRTNVDLWRQVGAELEDRSVSLSRIDSHLTPEEAAKQGLPAAFWLGNGIADELAGWAAKEWGVGEVAAKAVLFADGLGRSIRHRLAATFQDAVEKDPEQAAREDRPKFRRLALREARRRVSQHDVVWHGQKQAGGRCRRCGSTFEASKFAQFAATPCAREVNQITRGGRYMHHIHIVEYHAGLDLHICAACGVFSRMCSRGARFMGLSQACVQKTRRGQHKLRRVERNLLPGSSREALEHNRGRTQRRRSR